MMRRHKLSPFNRDIRLCICDSHHKHNSRHIRNFDGKSSFLYIGVFHRKCNLCRKYNSDFGILGYHSFSLYLPPQIPPMGTYQYTQRGYICQLSFGLYNRWCLLRPPSCAIVRPIATIFSPIFKRLKSGVSSVPTFPG